MNLEEVKMICTAIDRQTQAIKEQTEVILESSRFQKLFFEMFSSADSELAQNFVSLFRRMLEPH